jgi:hypothetical protein
MVQPLNISRITETRCRKAVLKVIIVHECRLGSNSLSQRHRNSHMNIEIYDGILAGLRTFLGLKDSEINHATTSVTYNVF